MLRTGKRGMKRNRNKNITYTDDCRVHEFCCMNKGCKYKCQCFLDNDPTSTGNMIKAVGAMQCGLQLANVAIMWMHIKM